MSRTYGQKYDPIKDITTQTEADEYFENLVAENMSQNHNTRAEAVEIEKHNIGYWSGYYSEELQERVERLFNCIHPIFGSINDKEKREPKNAFALGAEMMERKTAGIEPVYLPQPKDHQPVQCNINSWMED